VPDHCSPYSLSDPKDPDFQKICKDHTHLKVCDRCQLINTVLHEIKHAVATGSKCSLDEQDEMHFVIKQAEQSTSWHGKLI
jgi:hypothetical protein